MTHDGDDRRIVLPCRNKDLVLYPLRPFIELAAEEEVHSRDGVLYRPLVTSIRERLVGLPPEARASAVRTYLNRYAVAVIPTTRRFGLTIFASAKNC